MTAAVASRAAGAATGRAGATAVRTGPVTDAERANLAAKIQAAQAKATPAKPASAPPAKPAPKPASTPPAPSTSTSPTPAPSSSTPAEGGQGPRLGWGESIGTSTAGLIVGVLFWGWIVLPLIRGGTTEVRNTLRAKFLNKGPRGEWLP